MAIHLSGNVLSIKFNEDLIEFFSQDWSRTSIQHWNRDLAIQCENILNLVNGMVLNFEEVPPKFADLFRKCSYFLLIFFWVNIARPILGWCVIWMVGQNVQVTTSGNIQWNWMPTDEHGANVCWMVMRKGNWLAVEQQSGWITALVVCVRQHV